MRRDASQVTHRANGKCPIVQRPNLGSGRRNAASSDTITSSETTCLSRRRVPWSPARQRGAPASLRDALNTSAAERFSNHHRRQEICQARPDLRLGPCGRWTDGENCSLFCGQKLWLSKTPICTQKAGGVSACEIALPFVIRRHKSKWRTRRASGHSNVHRDRLPNQGPRR
jgi:hypothetical protein